MVTAAEYKQVLGHPVRIRPGEGSSSCNVLVGGSFAHDIIPNLNPYNAAYIKRMLSTMPGKQRVASLGPVGYVVVGTDGSVTSYAEKHGWFIAFQGLKGTEQGTGDQARAHRAHAPLTKNTLLPQPSFWLGQEAFVRCARFQTAERPQRGHVRTAVSGQRAKLSRRWPNGLNGPSRRRKKEPTLYPWRASRISSHRKCAERWPSWLRRGSPRSL